jgi:hypothetical protein
MIESAQSWLGVALPILSVRLFPIVRRSLSHIIDCCQKNEPPPTLKASMRLLNHIFSAATDVPEFQRQLATPYVPKFSVALISLAENQDDREVKVIIPHSVDHKLYI